MEGIIESESWLRFWGRGPLNQNTAVLASIASLGFRGSEQPRIREDSGGSGLGLGGGDGEEREKVEEEHHVVDYLSPEALVGPPGDLKGRRRRRGERKRRGHMRKQKDHSVSVVGMGRDGEG
ncbi:hypothetical protein ACLB2K_036652 [Fragaria x ananassa]